MTSVTVRKVTFGEGRPKICIPLMGKNKEQILEAAKQLQSLPADLIEWRADDFCDLHKPQEVTKILALLREIFGRDMPVLFTIRTKKEGGQAELSVSDYIHINCAASEGEADLVDVEWSLGRKTADGMIKTIHANGKKVILSNHDFCRTPDEEELIRRMRQMQEWGADISKLAVMPRGGRDVLKLLSATLAMKETYADRPFITMSMGADGISSRLCGETFGSCITFGCGAHSSAPGQIEAKVLQQVLDAVHNSYTSHLPCHLFLIGFMGTGKSTIAKILGRNLGAEQIEMDQRIVENEGMEINEIFSRYGEEYFRNLETEALRELNQIKPAVISCGGGIVLRKENIRLMQEMGKTVLLTASPETVLARVEKDNSRPNLKGRKTVEGIGELMDRRKAYYQAAAQISIATDGIAPDKVARQVMKAFCIF